MKKAINVGYTLLFIATLMLPLFAVAFNKAKPVRGNDTISSVEIKKQLNSDRLSLHFPKSTRRFYNQNNFQTAWIKAQNGEGPTWQAMLLLNCVLQFGLAHADYHPNELQYADLHEIMDTPEKIEVTRKIQFDILLTDAMITLINHLHFGKINPYYSSSRIDNGNISGFNAVTVLLYALEQKKVMSNVINVQPKFAEYVDLQQYLTTKTQLYMGNCNEIPDSNIRKIAINMERLRWAGLDQKYYIHINIPSFSLKFHQPDTTYLFKVIVGKKANPTPTLNSDISYFTTVPEWRVPQKIFRRELLPKALHNASYLENSHFAIYDKKGNYMPTDKASLLNIAQDPGNYYAKQSSGCDNALGMVVFRFQNPFDIYLHDTPEQQLFQKENRAFSHGCIRVEQAEILASLFLKSDGSEDKIRVMEKAITNYQTRNFNLRRPVPISITYLTCQVKKKGLIKYKDIYNLDKSLEMALYNANSFNN